MLLARLCHCYLALAIRVNNEALIAHISLLCHHLSTCVAVTLSWLGRHHYWPLTEAEFRVS